MFARGNWASFRIDTSSLPDFQQTFTNVSAMFDHSQLAANLQARTKLGNFSGINPFSQPRKDEIFQDDSEDSPSRLLLQELMKVITEVTEAEARYPLILERNLPVARGFATLESTYRLHENSPLYGLWFVQNEWKDVEHEASKREDVAYRSVAKPFKLVDAKQKESIIADVDSNVTITRKQFPVLINYLEGIVFAESTDKGALFELQTLLGTMGVKIIPTAWNFGEDSNWPTKFLNHVFAESRFKAEFEKYAKDSTIFNKGEQEEGEPQDLALARLLDSYFASTDLDTDVWVSLGTPANVSLSPNSAPISVGDSANVTLLLRSQAHSQVVGSSITLQEVQTRYNKKTEKESTWRRDLVAVNINQNMNLVEVGCAILKGFDLPTFKKEAKKDTSVIGVENYWLKWLTAMTLAIRELTESISAVLEVNAGDSGIQPMGGGIDNDIAFLLREISNRESDFEVSE